MKIIKRYQKIGDIYINHNNCLGHMLINKLIKLIDLKIKEALHINWRKPNLNAQQNHLTLTISL